MIPRAIIKGEIIQLGDESLYDVMGYYAGKLFFFRK